MPLLNYTTKVNTHKTVSEIQTMLATHGARGILMKYDDNGYIVSLAFVIHGPADEPIQFQLPVDWQPVFAVLERDRRVPRSLVTQEQALRVAWRIVKDWIRAQMAFLDTEMVVMEQVFLPYMLSTQGKTLYEVLADSRFQIGSGDQNDILKEEQ